MDLIFKLNIINSSWSEQPDTHQEKQLPDKLTAPSIKAAVSHFARRPIKLHITFYFTSPRTKGR